MTETSEIGRLARRRRGVAPGTFLLWIILAAIGGAVVWAIYGDGVRSILKLPPASAHWTITQTNQNQPTATNLNEVVGLVKDLQASQQRTAEEVRMTLQLLTSEQAATQAATKPYLMLWQRSKPRLMRYSALWCRLRKIPPLWRPASHHLPLHGQLQKALSQNNRN